MLIEQTAAADPRPIELANRSRLIIATLNLLALSTQFR
jgi:hypothetical protein